MRDRTPDAIYTKDPGLTRAVLRNRHNTKTHGWYRFHHRLFDYRTMPDILTYKDADDPAVVKMRKVYTAGLSEEFDRRKDQIAAHISQWVDEVARGPVDVARSIRRLNVGIVYLVILGEPPRERLAYQVFENLNSILVDPKKRLAHLLWPVLDRLPTPYSLGQRTRGLLSWFLVRRDFRRFRDKPKCLLSTLEAEAKAAGMPDFAWQAYPLLMNAMNAIPPFPMAMSLYLLSASPKLQQRVIDDDLYQAVIKETLRLFPPVNTIARIVRERVESNGVVIEKMIGDEGQLYVNPTGIHRDRRAWAQPDEFVIDRWLPDWKEEGDPDRRLFIPFGMGARSCIGASYSSKVLELFLRTVLPKRVVTNPSGCVPNRAEGCVSVVRRPLKLEFSERRHPASSEVS
jgi:cytochrome P450